MIRKQVRSMRILTAHALELAMPRWRTTCRCFVRACGNSTAASMAATESRWRLTTQKCTDPTADMKKKNEEALGTCKMSPVARSGNLYTFSAECTILGVSMQSKSVITAESDSAYRVDVEALQDGITTRELLNAKRVGDC